MAKQTVRKPYAVGIKRREEILDAAQQLFAVQGFRGAALADIAAEVGLTLAGLLHYFTSKEDLLSAVLKRRDDSFAPPFERTLEETGSFCRAVHEVMAQSVASPDALRLFITLAAEATDPEHPSHAYFQKRYRLGREHFAALLAEAQASGEIDPTASGSLLMAVLDGLQLQWLHVPDFEILDEVDRYMDSIAIRKTVEAR
ncbi:MAG TPA: TetR/AcrR family transcriptional regulator [Acidimicrobiales bacterium]|jgi:AcrR family transcriptional regulator